jgi:maleylpyruvate isomerase
VAELPFRRWREVEVHHVDLDLGYGPADWPDAYVEEELARTVAGLDGGDRRRLLAWLVGRAGVPKLGAWRG